METPAEYPASSGPDRVDPENDENLVTELVYQRYLELNAMEEALAERRESLSGREER
jgi:hypothetical protein